MLKKWGLKASLAMWAAFLIVGSTSGCNSADTSGIKPVPQLSRDEINKQIADLRANPKVPDGFKENEIKKLQAQLQSAK